MDDTRIPAILLLASSTILGVGAIIGLVTPDTPARAVEHVTKPVVSVSETVTVPEDTRFTLSPVTVTAAPAPAPAPAPAEPVLIEHVIFEDGSGRDTYSDGSIITFCLEGQLCDDGTDPDTVANTEGWEWDCETMGNKVCGPVEEESP